MKEITHTFVLGTQRRLYGDEGGSRSRIQRQHDAGRRSW